MKPLGLMRAISRPRVVQKHISLRVLCFPKKNSTRRDSPLHIHAGTALVMMIRGTSSLGYFAVHLVKQFLRLLSMPSHVILVCPLRSHEFLISLLA